MSLHDFNSIFVTFTAPPPPPPPPSMGSLAMGMPFQVFPSGPPVKKNQQSNGSVKNSPQTFAPPPMALRPEIKIPVNPMAALKPTPRPQPKNDYWVQEYVEEKMDSIPSEQKTTKQIAASAVMNQYQQQTAQKEPSPIRYTSQRSASQAAVPIRSSFRTEIPMQGSQSSPVTSSVSPILSSPIAPVKTVTIEPTLVYMQPQSYQQPQQSYQQPSSFQQPPQIYQQPPQLSYQQPQIYQQPSSGGRVILSTMPKKTLQQAQQHVIYPYLLDLVL